ncbi:hypothetical protein H5410_004829 [Solanum commersonii]|uniref:Uncharacterized protein n=1 Tax=Solanum commersonii TaxID=4109 RepID=A0A9J6A5P1_SOLCO|nr:hypothetical protein H5410_004829 [Solanum commersonii]
MRLNPSLLSYSTLKRTPKPKPNFSSFPLLSKQTRRPSLVSTTCSGERRQPGTPAAGSSRQRRLFLIFDEDKRGRKNQPPGKTTASSSSFDWSEAPARKFR